MVKKSNNIALILILVAVVAVAAFFFMNKGSTSGNIMTWGAYDSSGKRINTAGYSVVNSVPGVAQIDLSINVQNTGNTPLTCQILSASPSAFDSNINKNTFTVNAGQTSTITSNRITASQFEALGTVAFSANVRCTYSVGAVVTTLPTQTGQVSLTFAPDATGSFNVAVTYGGTSGGSTQRVVFRTNSASATYPSGSWVALDRNADNTLECYVYTTRTTSAAGNLIIADVYGANWNMYGTTEIVQPDIDRIFAPGTGCELSTSSVSAYAGKEKYA